jgi:putative PIN family toxin of toxin-antitoxin system
MRRVVLDTNVWVAGLIVPSSPPGRVLDAVRRRELEPVVSWELAEELVAVLRRPEMRRYGVTEGDVDDVVALLGPLLPGADVAVEVRDPDDAPVVAAAVAGNAAAVVTGDRDLLDDPALRAWLASHGVDLVTPADLLALLDR